MRPSWGAGGSGRREPVSRTHTWRPRRNHSPSSALGRPLPLLGAAVVTCPAGHPGPRSPVAAPGPAGRWPGAQGWQPRKLPERGCVVSGLPPWERAASCSSVSPGRPVLGGRAPLPPWGPPARAPCATATVVCGVTAAVADDPVLRLQRCWGHAPCTPAGPGLRRPSGFRSASVPSLRSLLKERQPVCAVLRAWPRAPGVATWGPRGRGWGLRCHRPLPRRGPSASGDAAQLATATREVTGRAVEPLGGDVDGVWLCRDSLDAEGPWLAV